MAHAFVVLALLVAACEHDPGMQPSEPSHEPAPGPRKIVEPPAPAPAPAPTPARPPRNVVSRDQLEGWMQPLPEHGLFAAQLGLGGGNRVVVDTVTRKLDARIELQFEKSPKPRSKTLSSTDVDELWKLAELAWRSPEPAPGMVTDYREVVVALDGDDAMVISVQAPLTTGDPAGKLAAALRKHAGWRP